MTTRGAAAVLMLTMLFIPRSLAAQTRWELSVGYADLEDPPDRIGFPSGWLATGAVGIATWLSAVADVGRGTHSTLDIDLATSAWLGGIRGQATVGRVLEFGQLLAGLSRSTSTVVGITSSENHLAIQPGAGIEAPVGTRFAGRLQVDYRAIRGGIGSPIADPRYQFRLSAQLVYHGCCR